MTQFHTKGMGTLVEALVLSQQNTYYSDLEASIAQIRNFI